MAEPKPAKKPTDTEGYAAYWGELSRPAEVTLDPSVSVMVARAFYDGPVRHLFSGEDDPGTSLELALEKALPVWLRQHRADTAELGGEGREELLLRVPKPQGGSMRKVAFVVKGDIQDWSRVVCQRFGTGHDAPCLFLRELLLLALTRQRDAVKRAAKPPENANLADGTSPGSEVTSHA
jgi:hypothetical protein